MVKIIGISLSSLTKCSTKIVAEDIACKTKYFCVFAEKNLVLTCCLKSSVSASAQKILKDINQDYSTDSTSKLNREHERSKKTFRLNRFLRN